MCLCPEIGSAGCCCRSFDPLSQRRHDRTLLIPARNINNTAFSFFSLEIIIRILFEIQRIYLGHYLVVWVS